MKNVVLLTGSGGFVGQAVLRKADEFDGLAVVPLDRDNAVSEVLDARRAAAGTKISILNLSWPSMKQNSVSASEAGDTAIEWQSYEQWLSSLVDAALQAKFRFFQAGSGIEPYALTEPPLIADPYLRYALRKHRVWRNIQAALPEASWRLRLHFLFGSGESGHRVVPAAIRACLTGAPLTVGAPGRRRCWLDVDDAARGLLTAILHPDPENWDICGSLPISFAELLSLIGEATGRAANLETSERTVADADCPVVEPARPAPFIPRELGEPDGLRSRLIDYAETFTDLSEANP